MYLCSTVEALTLLTRLTKRKLEAFELTEEKTKHIKALLEDWQYLNNHASKMQIQLKRRVTLTEALHDVIKKGAN